MTLVKIIKICHLHAVYILHVSFKMTHSRTILKRIIKNQLNIQIKTYLNIQMSNKKTLVIHIRASNFNFSYVVRILDFP